MCLLQLPLVIALPVVAISKGGCVGVVIAADGDSSSPPFCVGANVGMKVGTNVGINVGRLLVEVEGSSVAIDCVGIGVVVSDSEEMLLDEVGISVGDIVGAVVVATGTKVGSEVVGIGVGTLVVTNFVVVATVGVSVETDGSDGRGVDAFGSSVAAGVVFSQHPRKSPSEFGQQLPHRQGCHVQKSLLRQYYNSQILHLKVR